MAEPFISSGYKGIQAQPVSAVTSSTYGRKQEQKPQKDFQSMFQRLVEERKETLADTLEKKDEVKKELESLESQRMPTEIIRRTLPDGTIMVTHYDKGDIVNRFFKKPHMKAVPDESKPVPKAADGTPMPEEQKMKYVVKRALLDDLFG